jgi:hypothetical protein
MISILADPNPDLGKPKPQTPLGAPPDPWTAMMNRYRLAIYGPGRTDWEEFIVAYMLRNRGLALGIMKVLNDVGKESGFRPRWRLRVAKTDILKGITRLRRAGTLVRQGRTRIRIHEGIAEMLSSTYILVEHRAGDQEHVCVGSTLPRQTPKSANPLPQLPGPGTRRTSFDHSRMGFVAM